MNSDSILSVSENNVMTTSTSTNTAMSLWHKFSMWQSDMDKCRSTIQNIRQEQDRCREQIEELIHSRAEEQRKVHEIEPPELRCNISQDSSLSAKLLEKLRESQRKLYEVQDNYGLSITSLQNTKLEYETQIYLRNESIREAIEQSRIFHQKCQQIQFQLRDTAIEMNHMTLSSMSSDLSNSIETSSKAHSLRAALSTALIRMTIDKNNCDSIDDTWISKSLQDLQKCNFFDSTEMVGVGSDHNESDPMQWKVCQNKDLELYNAIAEYKQQYEQYILMLNEMQQVQSNFDMQCQKSVDRQQRKEQLQEQLLRIQSDCTQIETEIHECQQLTIEDQELACTYRAKIDQRKTNQSNNLAHRRIGLHHVEKPLFGQLSTQQRPQYLAKLIPPIQLFEASTSTNDPKSNEGRIIQNPYAVSRKRNVVATKICEVATPLQQRDMNAIVLGRPRRSEVKDGTVNSMMIPETEFVSRKQHRRRMFRDRFEFGCSVELFNSNGMDVINQNHDNITTHDANGTNQLTSQIPNCLDGDIGGGATTQCVIQSSNQERLSVTSTSDDSTYDTSLAILSKFDPLEDDDELLQFIAFPVTHEQL